MLHEVSRRETQPDAEARDSSCVRNDTLATRRWSLSCNREARSGTHFEVGKLGKLGKGTVGPLTDREAAGIKGISADADLVAVEPAVPVAIRDSRIRAERCFVRIQ
jgi:hypothetical protein